MIFAPEFEHIALSNNSFLRKLSPYTKVFLTFVYLILNLLITSHFYFIFIIFVFLMYFISNIPFRYTKRPIFIALITSIVISLAKLHFLKKGNPIILIIDFYPESLFLAIIIGLKIFTGVLLIIIFISTTTIQEMMSVFKKIKAPDTFIDIFMIIFKYIFVLNDESVRMRNAQMVRLGYNGFRRSLESFGNLIGMVILRGISRCNNMSDALFLRGYKGKFFYPSDITKPKFYEYMLLLFLGILPLLLGLYVRA
ncbi:MAG: cobalt ECF transporter T component CbiQ [Proteobacteria bacterium]|nr:cobalt ECF transporter T component CbiQ [Pseudomonadota bacterium]